MARINIFKQVSETIKEHKPELAELAAAMVADGASRDEVIRGIVSAVDALIDWVAIGAIISPAGAVAGGFVETFDGPVAVALVKLFFKRQLPHASAKAA